MPTILVARIRKDTNTFKKGQKVFVQWINENKRAKVMGRYKKDGPYISIVISKKKYKLITKFPFEITHKFAYYLYCVSGKMFYPIGFIPPHWMNHWIPSLIYTVSK